MYKVVFIDLDGTLLDSQKKMSEYDRNVLKNLCKKVKIVFASARGMSRIMPFIQEIDNVQIDSYTLAFNGGLVLNNTQNVRLVDNFINKDNLKYLLEWAAKNKVSQMYQYTYSSNVKIIDGNLADENIYKIVVLDTEDNIIRLKESIDGLSNLFEITSSEPTRIEFVQKGITKAESIQKLLDMWKFSPLEMIAIGDGENDVSMLKMAGLGIAMGNAPDKVKQIADAITDTNDNSGVGKILSDIFYIDKDEC